MAKLQAKTTVRSPEQIFTMYNPTGLVFTRELYLWGFLTYSEFTKLRGEYLGNTVQIHYGGSNEKTKKR